MRILTVALVLGTLLAPCTAHRAKSVEASNVLHSRVLAPRVTYDPNWIPDYYIVPRYRYNPRDDRVDTSPTAKPVAPAFTDYGGTGGSGW
jgi:hypothetical protein